MIDPVRGDQQVDKVYPPARSHPASSVIFIAQGMLGSLMVCSQGAANEPAGQPSDQAPLSPKTAVFDMLPTARAGDFSVLRRGLRHTSLKALPEPLYILAALRSRCRLVPQSGQLCQRTDNPF